MVTITCTTKPTNNVVISSSYLSHSSHSNNNKHSTAPASSYSGNDNNIRKDNINKAANSISRLPGIQEGIWGRNIHPGPTESVVAFLIMLFCPFLSISFISIVQYYNGSIQSFISFLLSNNLSIEVLILRFNEEFYNPNTIIAYLGWILLQIILYLFVPGPINYGSRTPAGTVLSYKTNGLNCYMINHILLVIAVFYFNFPLYFLYDNWLGFCLLSNFMGIFISFLMFIKSKICPTHPEDNKITNNFLYDFFMGCELNPRIDFTLFNEKYSFDFKLFFNGRMGIEMWPIIILSHIHKQYTVYGEVSFYIILLYILQQFYIIDFFYYESWYLQTIDIHHDHFGFMLAWGDCVWLPYTYTLQSLYLVHNHREPIGGYRNFDVKNYFEIAVILTVGIIGYLIFRLSNNQKYAFRNSKGNIFIWNKPAKSLDCEYYTYSSIQHKIVKHKHNSSLLISGYWSLARKMNYLGDIILSFTWSWCCGFQHLLPWYYFFYISLLLVTRTERDDHRCRIKYGKQWEKYCKIVKFKLIPGIY